MIPSACLLMSFIIFRYLIRLHTDTICGTMHQKVQEKFLAQMLTFALFELSSKHRDRCVCLERERARSRSESEDEWRCMQQYT